MKEVVRATFRGMWWSWRRAFGGLGAWEAPSRRLITPGGTMSSFPKARVPVERSSSLIVDDRVAELRKEEEGGAFAERLEEPAASRRAGGGGALAALPPPPMRTHREREPLLPRRQVRSLKPRPPSRTSQRRRSEQEWRRGTACAPLELGRGCLGAERWEGWGLGSPPHPGWSLREGRCRRSRRREFPWRAPPL